MFFFSRGTTELTLENTCRAQLSTRSVLRPVGRKKELNVDFQSTSACHFPPITWQFSWVPSSAFLVRSFRRSQPCNVKTSKNSTCAFSARPHGPLVLSGLDFAVSHRARQFENGRGLVHSRCRAVVKQRGCKRHHVSHTRRWFTSINAPVSGWK